MTAMESRPLGRFLAVAEPVSVGAPALTTREEFQGQHYNEGANSSTNKLSGSGQD
jgi:hypothetical protein